MNPSALCSQCCDINLGSLFDGFDLRGEQVLCQLWTPANISANPSCPLCRVFLEHKLGGDSEPHELRHTSDGRDSLVSRVPMGISSRGRRRLIVIPTSHAPLSVEHELFHKHREKPQLLCCQTESSEENYNPCPPGAMADLKLARQCLEHCLNNHSECPAQARSSFELSLIDCSSLRVVSNSMPCRYAALSYVWGPGQSYDQDDTVGKPLRNVPKTISDAIEVCLALGIPYLWADRYCISHDDPVKQADQINNMNRIYEQATLTIIAKSGLNSEAGLLGVGKPRRPLGPRYQLDGFEVAVHPPQPDSVKFKWDTRGWTLQEDFFSRRSLEFDDHQFVFGCGAMRCFEVEASFVQKLLYEETQTSSKELLHYSVAWHQKKQFPQLVMSYTGRQLTLPSDSLRAFAGVLQHFSEVENPVYHVWGLAITETDVHSVLSFLTSLCWEHTTTSVITRRPGFVSWTWAGWGGPIRMPRRVLELNSTALASICFEYDTGDRVTLDLSFIKELAKFPKLAQPRVLHINNATVISTSAFRKAIYTEREVDGSLPPVVNMISTRFKGEISLSQPQRYRDGAGILTRLRSGELKVLLISKCKEDDRYGGFPMILCLVIEEYPEASRFERVGALSLCSKIVTSPRGGHLYREECDKAELELEGFLDSTKGEQGSFQLT